MLLGSSWHDLIFAQYFTWALKAANDTYRCRSCWVMGTRQSGISIRAEGSSSNGEFSTLVSLFSSMYHTAASHLCNTRRSCSTQWLLYPRCCTYCILHLGCRQPPDKDVMRCSPETKSLAIVVIQLCEPDTQEWQLFTPIRSRPEIWQVWIQSSRPQGYGA